MRAYSGVLWKLAVLHDGLLQENVAFKSLVSFLKNTFFPFL